MGIRSSDVSFYILQKRRFSSSSLCQCFTTGRFTHVNTITTALFSSAHPEETNRGGETLSDVMCPAQTRLQCVINHRKIICSSELPRSLISFVPIDLTAIAETRGGVGIVGSIPAIDQKLNDLVYTVTVETNRGMRKKLHHSKAVAGFNGAMFRPGRFHMVKMSPSLCCFTIQVK